MGQVLDPRLNGVLKIELNEQEVLLFLIDFYPILGIPDFHCHLSRHYGNSSHVSCRVFSLSSSKSLNIMIWRSRLVT